MGLFHSAGVVTYEQTGTWRYLLCDDCEQFFGEAESHVVGLCRDFDARFPEMLRSIRYKDHLVHTSKFDLQLLQRFVLGNTFRYSFKHEPADGEFWITSEERETLRRWLRADKYTDRGIHMAVKRLVTNDRINPAHDGALITGRHVATLGTTLSVAGWVWDFWVNYESHPLVEQVLAVRFDLGVVPIYLLDRTSHPASQFHGELNSAMPPEMLWTMSANGNRPK